jgi:hypothetical protein
MKTQIDIKSALLGLAIGIITMFAIGAGTSSNPAGKYQIAAASAPNGAFFAVVDTQTGEVWGVDSTREWGNAKASQFWGAKNN